MGNCISWDRNKSIWAVRILSEVLLCTGIVACVAAFTIEVCTLQLLSQSFPRGKHILMGITQELMMRQVDGVSHFSSDPNRQSDTL